MKVVSLVSVIVCLVLNINLSHAQVPAEQDTIVIPGGMENRGALEATINADTVLGGGRINKTRVYKLHGNNYYYQNKAIIFKDAEATLTIVGEKGGRKPVIIMQGVGGVLPDENRVEGSLKLVNLHWQGMIDDGTFNNSIFVCTTKKGLSQSLTVDNCLMEFIFLEWFQCDGWTNGAKFKITNSYFRNLFYSGNWWGGRITYCKQPIDTMWVENCTVTDGGLVFLQQNALCQFAYYNHNTIINSNKYWQLGFYYLEGYWVNNLFINQNWVGEDYENVLSNGADPEKPMLTSTMNLDTITVQGGSTAYHINIQPEFLLPDGKVDESKCGLDKIKIFISNNVQCTDTILNAYYKNYNHKYNDVGDYPVSYLTWMGLTGPFKVVNVPGIWMNSRTKALIDAYPNMVETNNYVEKEVKTVTPAIKDMSVVDQMAWWNDAQWGLPGVHENDISHSEYIFGDFDPNTIPGYKTEDGEGITKFTDLTESFAQTETIYYSKIDGLPMGSLIWNDDLIAGYDSKKAYQKVMYAYAKVTKVMIENTNSEMPEDYISSRNYPNPFNPSTTIQFTVPVSGKVELAVFNMLGQKVRTLLNSETAAGSYKAQFDGKDDSGLTLSSGVYFYQIKAGNLSVTNKMVLLE